MLHLHMRLPSSFVLFSDSTGAFEFSIPVAPSVVLCTDGLLSNGVWLCQSKILLLSSILTPHLECHTRPSPHTHMVDFWMMYLDFERDVGDCTRMPAVQWRADRSLDACARRRFIAQLENAAR